MQPRKNFPRTFNPQTNNKNYPNPYQTYSQPIPDLTSQTHYNQQYAKQRGEQLHSGSNGANTQRVPLQMNYQAQSNHRQPTHQGAMAGGHHMAVSSSSNQSLINQAPNSSSANTQPSTINHGIDMPVQSAVMQAQINQNSAPMTVMFPGGQHGQAFYPPIQSQKYMHGPVIYPYTQPLQIQSHQYPSHPISAARGAPYGAPIPTMPPQASYIYPNTFGPPTQVAPNHPQQPPPQMPKPVNPEVKARARNPIKIIDPATGQEVDPDEPSDQTDQSPNGISKSPVPNETGLQTTDAAQEFAQKVAASINKEASPEKAETDRAPVEISVTELPPAVVEPQPAEEPVAEETAVPVVEEIVTTECEEIIDVDIESVSLAEMPASPEPVEDQCTVSSQPESELAAGPIQFGDIVVTDIPETKDAATNHVVERSLPPEQPPSVASEPTPQDVTPPPSEAPAEEESEKTQPFRKEDFLKDGVLTYSKEFIMSKQRTDLCMERPTNLPNLEIVRNEPHAKPFDQKQMPKDFYPFGQSRGGSQHGGYNNRSRKNESQRREGYGSGGHGHQQKVVNINIQTKDLKHKAANPWKIEKQATVDADSEEERLNLKMRKIRSILNKLTPDNFERCMRNIAGMNIKGDAEINALRDLIFEKAASEDHFAELYAKMVKHLMDKVKPSPNEDKSKEIDLKKAIVVRCQHEFERTHQPKEDKKSKYVIEIENCMKLLEEAKKNLEQNPNDESRKSRVHVCKNLVEEAIYSKQVGEKKYRVGTVIFVGQLFKYSMVNGKVILTIISELLKERSELSMECLFKLMKSIGSDFNTRLQYAGQDNVRRFNQFFAEIAEIGKSKDNPQISFRTRCFALDLMELRSNEWVPRNKTVGPTTTKEIQQKARAEQAEKEYQKQQDKMSYQDYPQRRNPVQNNSEWSTAGTCKRNDGFDVRKFATRTNQAHQGSVELRPARAANWGGGSSGGLNTSDSPATNRFSALSSEDRPRIPRPDKPRQVAGSTKSTPGPSSTDNTTAMPRSSNADRCRSTSRGGDVRRRSPSYEVNVSKLQSNSKIIMEEVMMGVHNKEDVLYDISQLKSQKATDQFFYYALEAAVSVKKDHHKCGLLLGELIKLNKFSQEAVAKGIKELMEIIEDMKLDCPFAYKHCASVFEGIVEHEGLTVELLKSHICDSEPGKEIFGLINVSSSVTQSLPQIEVQICEKLRNDTVDNVISFVQNEVTVDKSSKEFIRAVTKATIRSCAIFEKGVFKDFINKGEQIFEARFPLLQFCIDNNPELELQSVFALQSLAVELQFPLNFFNKALAALYECDVIAEETLIDWVKDDSPEEQEGKGVCLSSSQRFISYMKETDADADQS